jgi:hypothetical protein
VKDSSIVSQLHNNNQTGVCETGIYNCRNCLNSTQKVRGGIWYGYGEEAAKGI